MKGISLSDSHNNTITGNTISNNREVGIELSYSFNNTVYHNNFINNLNQIRLYESLNTWNDGYPSGGNYWSDYIGVDLHHGPYQNITGSDGISDIPYVIDEYNVDRYPLMSPWTPKPSTPPYINATVDIVPNTLNLKSRGKWITAYIELPKGYGIRDVNVSSIILNDNIPVEPKPIAVGDYDNDTVPDLMVKFDRQSVLNYIMANVDLGRLYKTRSMTMTLTITGKLNDGTMFQGIDTVRIILPILRYGRHLKLYPYII